MSGRHERLPVEWRLTQRGWTVLACFGIMLMLVLMAIAGMIENS